MRHAEELQLDLSVDDVLRAQGADPTRIRVRGSTAVAVAEEALAEGLPLVAPAVATARMPVLSFQHRRIIVGSGRGHRLSGPLVARHLHSASEIEAIVCTIGPALERLAAATMGNDPARSVALDALGSAAVEQVATLASARVQERAAADGLCSTLPISPGLIGWPLDIGQRQLFALVDAAAIGVELTEGMMMAPQKSRSLVIGLGANVLRDGEVCDYCTMRETCRYREAVTA